MSQESNTPNPETTIKHCPKLQHIREGGGCCTWPKCNCYAQPQPQLTSDIAPGTAYVDRVGWEEDEEHGRRFTATLVFPTGAPELTAAVVWKKLPVKIEAQPPYDAREPAGEPERFFGCCEGCGMRYGNVRHAVVHHCTSRLPQIAGTNR